MSFFEFLGVKIFFHLFDLFGSCLTSFHVNSKEDLTKFKRQNDVIAIFAS